MNMNKMLLILSLSLLILSPTVSLLSNESEYDDTCSTNSDCTDTGYQFCSAGSCVECKTSKDCALISGHNDTTQTCNANICECPQGAAFNNTNQCVCNISGQIIVTDSKTKKMMCCSKGQVSIDGKCQTPPLTSVPSIVPAPAAPKQPSTITSQKVPCGDKMCDGSTPQCCVTTVYARENAGGKYTRYSCIAKEKTCIKQEIPK